MPKKLKHGAQSPDKSCMIFTSDAPIESCSSVLRALYVSLNSPVVNLEKLPVGPAAAAVALHGPGPGVTLAVRSVRTGRVLFFTSDASGADGDDPEVLFDAVFSFAEGLGFLFDDDEVIARGTEGPRLSAHLWAEFVGEEVGELEDAPPGSVIHEPVDSEIILDQRVEEGSESAEAARVLSKFRRTWTGDMTQMIGAVDALEKSVASGA
jgi:hypothetical protein